MNSFIDQIPHIISSNELALNRKITEIKEILSNITVTQAKPSIDDSDTTIETVVTYLGNTIEGVGICAKDVDAWSFKPSRTKENGIASVKIAARGDKKSNETFFIITNFWKNRFFEENSIEVPYFKVNLS